ncbi:hypothetical protein L1987_70834 [Smallanthus sonchifolius]|uniref:Uncharacterized protein n=1 Tax=Smallanthus sonchifolius TaxID=185202 RepID=A0ACB9ARE5_9ASTR|nr:hypothetical protein L1987_70834 [Smallanthus sonchifolius]
MSVLGEYPEAINDKKDLQIWNNSAFDDGGDSESFNLYNQIKSPSSFSSKENQSPIGFSKSSVVVHPLHQSKPLKNQPIKIQNLEKTDEEIEIENEISRLVAKLESIRLERAEKNAKVKEFGVKKIQESRNKIQRRGFSLGPNEIFSATDSKRKQPGTTPIQATQNRRKSCFWKLDDIEEEKSWVSRVKNPGLRQAVTTVGTRKGVKKDDLIMGSIQPKKLFGEPVKKPVKPGRVVPSRYNQPTVNSSMKKRSLTDNVEWKSRGGTEGRVKKKWDVPGVIVIPKRLDLDDCENENEDSGVDVVMPEMLLPRIRVARCAEQEAGRDSGPAKRVAELVGKKSYFDECQKLSFDED